MLKQLTKIFAGAALALLSGWASAYTLSLAGPNEIDAGDPLTLAVVLQPGSGGLEAADVAINFDPTRAAFTGVTLGSLLAGQDWTDPFATNFPDGVMTGFNRLLVSALANVAALPPGNPAGELFRVSFDVVAPGGSSLTFAFPAGGSELGFGQNVVFPTLGAPFTVRVRGGGAQLPEPSSALLACTVLALGAGFATRRRCPDNS